MAKRNITIHDIADLCHVSTATVSRALNGKPGVNPELKDSIVRCAEEYGYTFNSSARNLRTKRTNYICIVTRPNPANIVMLPPLDARRITAETGLDVRMVEVPFDNDLAAALHQYETVHRPQLFIVPGPCGACRDTAFSSIRTKLLFVLSDDAPEGPPAVVSDDYHGARMVIDSLIEAGHTNIGVLTERDATGEMHYQARIQGYKDSLADHGIAYDPTLICSVCPDYGDYFPSTSSQIRESLVPCLDRRNETGMNSDITALFVLSDFLALPVMRELWNVGIRIPDQLSLASFGGWDFTGMIPVSTRSWVQPLDSIIETMLAAATFMVHSRPFHDVRLQNASPAPHTATALHDSRLVVPGYLRRGQSVDPVRTTSIHLARQQSIPTALKRTGRSARTPSPSV